MYYQTKTGTPCAYISKDRKRLKQFGQTVYLNNGDEFQLELYNPSSTTVLAKIKLDGSYISGGGIVLKPGQRVFLERYLDDARKFKFETYEVDGTSNEVLDAISGNGDVVIDFFDEYKQPVFNNPITVYGGSFGGPTYTTYGTHTVTTGNANYSSTVTGNASLFNTNIVQTSFTGPNKRGILGPNKKGVLRSLKSKPRGEVTMDSLIDNSENSIETGRVEKGGSSDQSFKTVNKTFNHFSTTSSIWKILPVSQQVFEKQDLKVYCGNCGTKKRRDSHLFCPHCGEKY